MNRKFAAAVLSAFLYAQGLLGFAGLATVLMRDRAHAAELPVAELCRQCGLAGTAH